MFERLKRIKEGDVVAVDEDLALDTPLSRSLFESFAGRECEVVTKLEDRNVYVLCHPDQRSLRAQFPRKVLTLVWSS